MIFDMNREWILYANQRMQRLERARDIDDVDERTKAIQEWFREELFARISAIRRRMEPWYGYRMLRDKRLGSYGNLMWQKMSRQRMNAIDVDKYRAFEPHVSHDSIDRILDYLNGLIDDEILEQ